MGIGPDKLPRVLTLREAGIDLSIILDSLDQAHAVVTACKQSKFRIPVLIEIDADDQRAGFFLKIHVSSRSVACSLRAARSCVV